MLTGADDDRPAIDPAAELGAFQEQQKVLRAAIIEATRRLDEIGHDLSYPAIEKFR